MQAKTLIGLGCAILLAGCSTSWRDSRANPSNWFTSNDLPETLVPVEDRLITDNRPLMAQVINVEVDETPGGIILTATGLPPTQGFWQGALVLDESDDEAPTDQYVFDFRAAPPAGLPPAGSERSREISVGYFIGNQDLRGINTIVVRAENNSRSLSP